jgi:hypothetical protein
MKNKIDTSIVAQDHSTISNVTNRNNKSTKRIRTESIIFGFIMGVVSSIVASFIYDHFIK